MIEFLQGSPEILLFTMGIKGLIPNSPNTGSIHNTDGSGLALRSQAKAQESARLASAFRTPTKNNSSPKSASNGNKKHSFLFNMYADVVKSLWKITTGVFAVESVKGILKDKNFSLAEVIDKTLRTDFVVSFGAYLLGAWGVRLFDGQNKFLGIKIPKLPSVLVGHGISNIFAKIYGTISSTELLNKASAVNTKTKTSEQITKHLSELPWMKALGKVNKFYSDYVENALTQFSSMLFGVKREKALEAGEKDTVSINWAHFASAVGLLGLGTFTLPKETQVYGMEDFSKSKGFWGSLGNGILYVLISTMSRLDCYNYYNIIGLHPEGYGFDRCLKTAIRDKMFPPILQSIFDVVSGYIGKVVPVNGAMLASIVTAPIDIIGAFLSAGLVGIAEETRVPDEWTYLGNKIWKPLSSALETILVPLFKYTEKPLFYQPLGLFPKEFEGQYSEEPRARNIPLVIEEKFKNQSFLGLLLKSTLKIPEIIFKTAKDSNVPASFAEEQLGKKVQSPSEMSQEGLVQAGDTTKEAAPAPKAEENTVESKGEEKQETK